jgi:hypothetical protein
MSDWCAEYRACRDVKPHGLNTAECFHFWDGWCENGMSPLAGQECPYEGWPGQGQRELRKTDY